MRSDVGVDAKLQFRTQAATPRLSCRPGVPGRGLGLTGRDQLRRDVPEMFCPHALMPSLSSAHDLDAKQDQYILAYMKAITLNVSEPVYADFQRFAQEQDRPTSELLREAMELYRQTKIRPLKSLRDLKPSSAGRLLQSWSGRADLLSDFLE